MHRNHYNLIFLSIFAFVFFSLSADAFAGWEIGANAGFDSNIDRSLDGGRSDSYMTGFLSFTREPGEGSDTDWSLNLTIEGTGYADSNDLNYGMSSMKPAIIFYPNPRWRVDISPFIQATVVNDDEQSAIAFGGEISMRQLWGLKYYTGEYFLYTDSKADVDVYSYREKAAGIFAGINWTEAFWSEIGYEFSRGDSFRAVGEISTTQDDISQDSMGRNGMGRNGMGGSPRYSEGYNEYIISEPVDRQTIGVNMGYQFTGNLFLFINYAYTSYKGDAGDSKSHSGSIGIGYRF